MGVREELRELRREWCGGRLKLPENLRRGCPDVRIGVCEEIRELGREGRAGLPELPEDLRRGRPDA